VLTTLVNPTLWLLAGLIWAAAWAAAHGAPAGSAIERFVGVAARRAVLLVLVALAVVAVSTRLGLGYLAPGAYAEEVVQARALLADRPPGAVDARTELAEWLREEPPATDPWLLPGLTPCQAGAMRERERFFSGQAHTPALVLASVPVVRVAGGRGLFVALSALALLALAFAWATLVAEAGWTRRSPHALVLGVALAGWQPALAALRQGDAVLVAAALLVGAWAAARRERWTPAGALVGLAGAVSVPAAVVLLALVRRPRALVAGLATMTVAALAVAAAGGPVLLVDFARNVAFTTRAFAEMPVNYALAGRLLARVPGWWLAAAALAVGAATVARTRRVDVAIAAFCPIAVLSAPVAWSQHLALMLVPAAVLGASAAGGSARALGAWALLLAAISTTDPAVSWLSEVLWATVGTTWPIVPFVVAIAWLAVLQRPGHEIAGRRGDCEPTSWS
jgi:hypothetical protein